MDGTKLLKALASHEAINMPLVSVNTRSICTVNTAHCGRQGSFQWVAMVERLLGNCWSRLQLPCAQEQLLRHGNATTCALSFQASTFGAIIRQQYARNSANGTVNTT